MITKRAICLAVAITTLQACAGSAVAAQPERAHYTSGGAPLAANLAVALSNSGGVQIWVTNSNFVIRCNSAKGTATLKVNGKATGSITYEGCEVRLAEKPGVEWLQGAPNPKCKVNSKGEPAGNGKIATGNMKMQLVWAEGAAIILNLVEPEGASFSEIEITTGAGEKCEEGGVNLVKTWKLTGSYLSIPAPAGIEQPSITEGVVANLFVNPAEAGNKKWEVKEGGGGALEKGEAKLMMEGEAAALSGKVEVTPKEVGGKCPNMGVHE
jgi:hypothetical protein